MGDGSASPAPPLTATVLPDLTGLDKTFDYLIPSALRDLVAPGSMVRVPLAGRRIGGWVLRVGPPGPDVPVDRLVGLASWSGIGPAPEIISLARWAAVRWGVGRLRPFLVSASPSTLVRTLPTSRARGPRGFGDADTGARQLLVDGGGVLRVSPSSDLLPVVLAAAERGCALVIHPHHDEARLLAAALRGRGLSVAVHPDDWAMAATGTDVVIGGRAAVWSTCKPASVVVLDEHDEALQEERSPTWHARDVAIERARRAAIPCLLTSPCPTVTALAWSGKRWMRPAAGVERDGWPIVDVVDRSDEEPWRRSLLTSALIAALRDHTKRVVCVHNTPGRARLCACRACRSLIACERCAASVQQADDGSLVCYRCGTTRPAVCQRCGSGALANVRPGVTRLREELEAAANRPVAAVTGRSDEHLPSVEVFVGTEAVLHRIHEADVVAFVDLDAELLAPRYRAAEQAFALLVRAARLLGPRRRGGRLLVQTFVPQHDVIQAALLADPGRLAKAEAGRRRDLSLPPFGALAAVSGPGAEEFVGATSLLAARAGDGFLVRADDWMTLGTALAETPRPKAARVRIEVDPPRR
jgi:primosomal protein N' (replication factor Y)